jgi:hypothetical protein
VTTRESNNEPPAKLQSIFSAAQTHAQLSQSVITFLFYPMDPISAAPVSVRRQTLMEQIRILEKSRQAHQQQASMGLPYQVNGPSLHDLLLSQEKLVGRNWSGPFGGLESLLRIDDMPRLQAAMRRSSVMDGSFSSPSTRLTNLSVMPSPGDRVTHSTGGYQNKLKQSLHKLSDPSGFNTHDKCCLAKEMDGMQKFKRFEAGLLKSHQRTPLVSQSGGFPLPSLRKARKAKGAALLSYKVLWANPNVRSSRTRKELFSRRLSRNSVEIVDKC